MVRRRPHLPAVGVVPVERDAGQAVRRGSARRQRGQPLGGHERRLCAQEPGFLVLGQAEVNIALEASRMRSAKCSWIVRPVARTTTSPLSAATMTSAWLPNAVPARQYGR
jgi:hypothetical protein